MHVGGEGCTSGVAGKAGGYAVPTAPKLVLVLRTSYLRCECVQRGSEAAAATSPGLIFCGTSVEPRKVSVNNTEGCGPRTQSVPGLPSQTDSAG